MNFYLGVIQYYAFGYAPKTTALCDGRLMSIAQNAALFSILGTTYGGNGTTTFALPDMRGRSMYGIGTNAGTGTGYNLGQSSGIETATMSATTMPAHIHIATAPPQGAYNTEGDAQDPRGNYPAVLSTRASRYGPAGGSTLAAPNVAVSSTGGNPALPFSVLAPYLPLTCSIFTQGIFPSRN